MNQEKVYIRNLSNFLVIFIKGLFYLFFYMVRVDEAFEVRYNKGKEHFEVLVDFDKLQEYRKDPQKYDTYDILADHKIYKDHKKGEIASETSLENIFGTTDESEILKTILLEGECQIPAEYLKKLKENKKELVVNYIAENATNPSTKTKYTKSMIESGLKDIKFNFDINRDHINQAEEVVKLLKKKMPISLEKSTIQLSVPPQYIGAFYGSFRKFGEITKEYYDRDGNLRMHIRVAEGVLDSALDYIKNNSNGEAEYYVENK